MQSKIIWIPIIAATLLLCLLVGCAGGIPQEQYDSLNAKLGESQAQVTKLQGEVKKLEEQNKSVDAQLKASQAKVTELEGKEGLK